VSDKSRNKNLARNLIVSALALFYLAVCAYCLANAYPLINKSFPGFLVLRNNYVSTFFRTAWPGNQAGLRNLDIILAVNNKPVKDSDELYSTVAHLGPGTPVVYDINSGGKQLRVTIPAAKFTVSDYIFCFPLAMLVGLYCYAAGLLVIFLKHRQASSWYFFLAFASLGLMFATNGERVTSHQIFFAIYAPALSAASFALFAMNFPAPIRRNKLISAVIVAALFAIMALYTRAYFSGGNMTIIDRISLVFTLLSFFFAVSVQVRFYMSSKDPVARQKVEIVILGFLISLASLIFIFFFAMIPRKMNFYYTFYQGAVIPLCLGYAIIKRGLFDMDMFIRRSLSYLLVSGIVVLIFFAVLFTLSLGLQNFSGQSSQIATVVSTLLIVMIFRPLKDRIDRVVDKRFFRERYVYTSTIRKASGILVSIIDLSQLLNQILDTVISAIKIERGLVYLKSNSPEQFVPAASNGFPSPEKIVPLEPGHPLVKSLESRGSPLQITDLEELDEGRNARELIKKMMQDSGVVLAVPIIYERRLIGILGLGEKKSGAWYSREDQELLQTLMIQTAVSIENARKVEDLKKMVELEASYRELERLDKMKDNFLSMVSHDLRTPMTSIKGYAAILLEKFKKLDEDRRRRYLSIIINESDRLTRLISDLLDLQRFEAGKMTLSLKEIDLAGLVRNSMESFQGAAMAKNQTLEQNVPDREIMVRADEDRLSQVVANLLSNATKFSPESGKIFISIELAALDGQNGVKVSVKDTGPGVAKEMQEKLFNKFQQVDNIVKSKEQGSGLGLALVREIVEHLGGKVGVESEPGKGSTFYFILPIINREG